MSYICHQNHIKTIKIDEKQTGIYLFILQVFES